MKVLLTHVLSQEKTCKSPDLGCATSVQYLRHGIVILSFFLSFCPTGYYFFLMSPGISLGPRKRYSGTNKKMTVICVVYLLVP
jgi:hypothetical protein